MPNKVTGSTDYLTVSGSAGSETYQAPDTTPYKNADTDQVWFAGGTAQRTVTTAELKGYDLQRTPVKYDNTTPNAIREIVILNADLTASEINGVSSYMQLYVWWSGVYNANGYLKDNRAGQSIFPKIEAETAAFLGWAGSVPTEARKTNIDNLIKYYKGANPTSTNAWSHLDVFVNLRGADAAIQTKNWIKNANHPTLMNSPTLTADVGLTTAITGSKYLKTGFIPATHGVNFLQDSASIGYKTSTYTYVSGAWMPMGTNGGASPHDVQIGQAGATSVLSRINSGSVAMNGATVPINGTNILTRISSTEFRFYYNGTKFSPSNRTSDGVSPRELYLGCSNENGTPNYFVNGVFEYYFAGGALTDADELVIRTGYAAYVAGL
jgi:hypothetical protein